MTIEELDNIVDALPERERVVLIEHYGIDGERKTLREIAAKFSISVTRVCEIQKRALRIIRARTHSINSAELRSWFGRIAIERIEEERCIHNIRKSLKCEKCDKMYAAGAALIERDKIK